MLTVGGRWFDNQVDVDAVVDVPIYSVFAPPGSASETISDDDFLAKANLAWDMSENSMLYLTYSQGYRHAGANAVPTTGKYAENPDFFTFDSDSVDNYELGYKGSTDRLNWAVSLYYDDWKDPQLNTATSNWGFFAAINGESAESQGIEIELSGLLGEHFSYSFGYTYADSQLTADVYQPAGNFYGGPLYTDRVGADGDRLPGSAEHVVTASLQHDMTFENGIELTTVLSALLPVGSQQQPRRRRVPHGIQCDRQLPRQCQPGVGFLCAAVGVQPRVSPWSTGSISGT